MRENKCKRVDERKGGVRLPKRNPMSKDPAGRLKNELQVRGLHPGNQLRTDPKEKTKKKGERERSVENPDGPNIITAKKTKKKNKAKKKSKASIISPTPKNNNGLRKEIDVWHAALFEGGRNS